MAGGYQVHIGELGRLIDTLEDGAEQVREANKTLAAVGQLNMLGHQAIADEGHEFEEMWEYGLDKLDETAEGVIERLADAKRNYETLEREHGDMLKSLIPGGVGSGVGGAGAGAGGVGGGAGEAGGGLGDAAPGGGWTGGIRERLESGS